MFIDEGKLPIPVSHNGLRTRSEIEKIIRIIPIKDDDKFKNSQLKLGVITINLSNIKGIN